MNDLILKGWCLLTLCSSGGKTTSFMMMRFLWKKNDLKDWTELQSIPQFSNKTYFCQLLPPMRCYCVSEKVQCHFDVFTVGKTNWKRIIKRFYLQNCAYQNRQNIEKLPKWFLKSEIKTFEKWDFLVFISYTVTWKD